MTNQRFKKALIYMNSAILLGSSAFYSNLSFANKDNSSTTVNQSGGFIDPFEQMELMHRKMDEIFNEAMKNMEQQAKQIQQFHYPLTNQNSFVIEDNNKTYTVKLKLPGNDKHTQYDVGVNGRQLTIVGKSKSESKNAEQQQFYSSNFMRSFTLPPDVDLQSMETKTQKKYLVILFKKKRDNLS